MSNFKTLTNEYAFSLCLDSLAFSVLPHILSFLFQLIERKIILHLEEENIYLKSHNIIRPKKHLLYKCNSIN